MIAFRNYADVKDDAEDMKNSGTAVDVTISDATADMMDDGDDADVDMEWLVGTVAGVEVSAEDSGVKNAAPSALGTLKPTVQSRTLTEERRGEGVQDPLWRARRRDVQDPL